MVNFQTSRSTRTAGKGAWKRLKTLSPGCSTMGQLKTGRNFCLWIWILDIKDARLPAGWCGGKRVEEGVEVGSKEWECEKLKREEGDRLRVDNSWEVKRGTV